MVGMGRGRQIHLTTASSSFPLHVTHDRRIDNSVRAVRVDSLKQLEEDKRACLPPCSLAYLKHPCGHLPLDDDDAVLGEDTFRLVLVRLYLIGSERLVRLSVG